MCVCTRLCMRVHLCVCVYVRTGGVGGGEEGGESACVHVHECVCA